LRIALAVVDMAVKEIFEKESPQSIESIENIVKYLSRDDTQLLNSLSKKTGLTIEQIIKLIKYENGSPGAIARMKEENPTAAKFWEEMVFRSNLGPYNEIKSEYLPLVEKIRNW
jgi:hypothetical protein